MDSYLLKCSDISHIKKNRNKNNVDATVQIADKPMWLNLETTIFWKPNLEDKFVNIIEKNMRSATMDKNLNVENNNNSKNSANCMHILLNNSTVNEISEKNIKAFCSTEKNSLTSNQRISNYLNSLPKHDNDAINQNNFKINSMAVKTFFCKSEFLERVNANKAIQAMKSFKFNREAILRVFE